MADPQTEHGHLRIANTLFDAALAYPFTARQLKALLALIRLTYGYHRKSDRIASSQIARLTNLQRQHAHRALQELEALGVIWRRQVGAQSYEMGVVKDYECWGKRPQNGDTSAPDVEAETVTETGTARTGTVPKSVHVRPQLGYGTVPKSVHTKDRRQFRKKERSSSSHRTPSSSKGEPRNVRAFLTERFGEHIVAQAYDRMTLSGRQILDPRAYLLAACQGIERDERSRTQQPKHKLSHSERARAAVRAADAQTVGGDDRSVRPRMDLALFRDLEPGELDRGLH